MSDLDNNAAQIIRDLATPTTGAIEGMPFAILPEGAQIKTFPELVAPKLHFTKATHIAHDVKGFTDYVNRFKLPNTALFAALEPKPALLAIIDYHTPDATGRGAHTVSCEMKHSEEWIRWLTLNGKPQSQKLFGLFLEDNQKDVRLPEAGKLLEMALNFSSMRKVAFRSGTRLRDGTVTLEYTEEEQVKSEQLPPRIEIGIPVFRNDKVAYKINARLKFEIDKESGLQIWYELERPDLVLTEAYEKVLTELATGTGHQVLRGMPKL